MEIQGALHFRSPILTSCRTVQDHVQGVDVDTTETQGNFLTKGSCLKRMTFSRARWVSQLSMTVAKPPEKPTEKGKGNFAPWLQKS